MCFLLNMGICYCYVGLLEGNLWWIILIWEDDEKEKGMEEDWDEWWRWNVWEYDDDEEVWWNGGSLSVQLDPWTELATVLEGFGGWSIRTAGPEWWAKCWHTTVKGVEKSGKILHDNTWTWVGCIVGGTTVLHVREAWLSLACLVGIDAVLG